MYVSCHVAITYMYSNYGLVCGVARGWLVDRGLWGEKRWRRRDSFVTEGERQAERERKRERAREGQRQRGRARERERISRLFASPDIAVSRRILHFAPGSERHSPRSPGSSPYDPCTKPIHVILQLVHTTGMYAIQPLGDATITA